MAGVCLGADHFRLRVMVCEQPLKLRINQHSGINLASPGLDESLRLRMANLTIINGPILRHGHSFALTAGDGDAFA
jgi:hypothetical protein